MCINPLVLLTASGDISALKAVPRKQCLSTFFRLKASLHTVHDLSSTPLQKQNLFIAVITSLQRGQTVEVGKQPSR